MAGLFRVPVLVDETLTSYLSRLARANECASSRQLCRDLGLSITLLNRGDHEEIGRLAELAGEPGELLRQHAVVVDDVDGATIVGSYFAKGKLRRSKLRFCPLCIAEDDNDKARMPGTRRYGRLRWMFPQVVTCPDHAIEIVESHHYQPQGSAHDFLTMLQLAENEDPEILRCRIPMKPSGYELFVCDRLSGCRHHGDILDNLTLAAGMAACELLGIGALYGRDASPVTIDDNSLRDAGDFGFASLKEGQQGLARLLDGIREGASTKNTRGGQAMYGQVYNALNTSYQHPEYDPLRKMVKDYTLSAERLINGADFFGKADTPWTTVNVLRKATGIPDVTIRKLLVELGHLPKMRQSREEQLVPQSALADVERLIDMIPLNKAATILGITVDLAIALVEGGILTPVLRQSERNDSNFGLLDRYSRRATEDLLKQLFEQATAETSAGLTPLREAWRKAGITYSEILQMILDGKLRKVATAADRNGLHRLLVDIEEIDALISSTEEVVVERREICTRLSLNHVAFAFLVANGHLAAERRSLRTARAPTWFVTTTAFNEFQVRYLTAAMIAKEIDVDPRSVRRLVRESGIALAFSVADTSQPIIERKDLGRLQAVVQRKKQLHVGAQVFKHSATGAAATEPRRAGLTSPCGMSR